MKLKQLKSLQVDVNRLDQLRNEIREINAYAKKVQDKTLDVRLNLSFTAPNLESERVRFDEDGSLITNNLQHPSHFSFDSIFGFAQRRNTITGVPSSNQAFNTILSEVAVLHILGVLISFKESERMAITNRLTAFGVEL